MTTFARDVEHVTLARTADLLDEVAAELRRRAGELRAILAPPASSQMARVMEQVARGASTTREIARQLGLKSVAVRRQLHELKQRGFVVPMRADAGDGGQGDCQVWRRR